MQILLRKISAVLRRITDIDEHKLTYGKIAFDLDGYHSYVDGKLIKLTQRF